MSKTHNRDANAATHLGALTRFELARLIHPLHVDHVRVRPLSACDESFQPEVIDRQNWVDGHWAIQSIRADVSQTFSALMLSVSGRVDHSERIFEYDFDCMFKRSCNCAFLE